MEYENIFKISLKVCYFFEDDRKFINIENAEIVLKMAGALSTVEVWQYSVFTVSTWNLKTYLKCRYMQEKGVTIDRIW